MNAEDLSIPLGSVVAYAGQLSGPELNSLGWAICDGSIFKVADNRELYSVLGSCNGGDGNTYFNIPDYQGLFLRGFDPNGKKDIDVGNRTAPKSGGASGAHVGSVQAFATANAHNSFKAKIEHCPTDWHNAYASSNCTMLIHGGISVESDSGGDTESRPVNAYVRYIIKTARNGGLLVGSVIPYAGINTSGSPTLNQNFLFCNGSQFDESEHAELSKTILKTHGGVGDRYNIPDYRGRFLRGMSGESERDKDANQRHAMAEGGNTGNDIGTIQDWMTALPKKPFTVELNIGKDRANSSVCAGHNNTAWNSNSSNVDLTNEGGDSETRPCNINVDFYILSKFINEETFPVGGIIGVPGSKEMPIDKWLLCDGSSLPNKGQYEDLYNAIGQTNGGRENEFALPDYRGYFLRGCDHGQGRDTDSKDRTAAQPGGRRGDDVGSAQDWATGKPRTSINAQVPHLPINYHHNAAALGGNKVANWVENNTLVKIKGGDIETRPINASIIFYVRYTA